ncbi:hypothetical protein PCANC_24912 [Puccinia coronata f. sp. avenae]|uniref:Uncharacterized protein n=1 Tax=Puccinia coronata f. sp. avenae TaxID=200324 RepID=A0A2N5V399_9BASI|nr:hypothetical protein PCANC_24912 [Puccinia coronata f. sp. avenae]PLW44488.1 hypothetical protein PCASD_11499 [Puccinia coronata f. sp. avenae]
MKTQSDFATSRYHREHPALYHYTSSGWLEAIWNKTGILIAKSSFHVNSTNQDGTKWSLQQPEINSRATPTASTITSSMYQSIASLFLLINNILL